MRPSSKFLYLISAWLILAIFLAVSRYLNLNQLTPSLSNVWWLSGVTLIAYALIDIYRSTTIKQVSAQRVLPSTLAVGVCQSVTLSIKNPLPHPLSAVITDHWPSDTKPSGMPVTVQLPPQGTTEVHYRLLANKRGLIESGNVDMRIRSLSGLWDIRILRGKPSQIRIYPNFSPVFHSTALTVDQQINRLGAHRMQKRGSGMDFLQLREFRKGDALRQVDWKASSRHRKLISREYQHERDQDIIFLMDCGRRMRAQDEGLSHFDHALNAIILTAWIALRQGDAVGFYNFAEKKGQQRWLSPAKGQATVNKLLQHTYDLHCSTINSDFLDAAEQLLTHHRKRSLVILVTNIREEDREDLQSAMQLLSSRHTVIVACLWEQILDQLAQRPISGFEDALNYAGTRHYLDQRQHLLKELRSNGIIIADAAPQALHVEMVTQYLRLKSSGRF